MMTVLRRQDEIHTAFRTVIKPGDVLIVLGEKEKLKVLEGMAEKKQVLPVAHGQNPFINPERGFSGNINKFSAGLSDNP